VGRIRSGLRLVGRLGSVHRLVGRIGLEYGLVPVFQKKFRLVGRLGSGPRLVADRADVDTRPENVAGGAGRLNDSQKLLVPPSAAIY